MALIRQCTFLTMLKQTESSWRTITRWRLALILNLWKDWANFFTLARIVFLCVRLCGPRRASALLHAQNVRCHLFRRARLQALIWKYNQTLNVKEMDAWFCWVSRVSDCSDGRSGVIIHVSPWVITSAIKHDSAFQLSMTNGFICEEDLFTPKILTGFSYDF